MRFRALVTSMNEQELRELFTGIGCIMEDVGVTALVWKHDDKRPEPNRAAELRRAHDEIGTILDKIEANVR